MHYMPTFPKTAVIRKAVGIVTMLTTLFATPVAAATVRVAPHPTAKTIITQMFKNLANSKTVHTTTQINIDSKQTNIKSKAVSGIQGQISMETYSNATNENNIASFTTLSASGAQLVGSKVTDRYDFGTLLLTQVNPGKTYVSYTASPLVQSFLSEFAGQDLAPIIRKYTFGQPIAVDKSSFSNLSKMLFGSSASSLNFTRLKQAQSLPSLSAQQNQKLVKTFQQSSAFNVVYKNLETIDGISAYHLQVTIRKQGLVPLINSMQKIMGLPALSKAEQIKMNKNLAATTLPAIDVWVGKNDLLPHRIVTSFTTTQKDYYETSKTTARIDMRMNEFDGLSVTIGAPNNSVKIEDVVKEITAYEAGYSDTSTVQGRDSKRLSDLKQLQTGLELFYVDHNFYPTGADLMLGSVDATCLSDNGWEKTGCNEPYMSKVPGDAFGGTFMYNRVSSSTYTVDARLEGAILDLSGAIRLIPSGIYNSPQK